jgi:uncharacterized protein (TIGR03066 family)
MLGVAGVISQTNQKRMCIMRQMGTIVLGWGLLLLGTAGAAADDKADKAAKMLVGKWEATVKSNTGKEIKIQLEFTKDNKLVVSYSGVKVEGKYKVVDEKTLEVERTFMGKTMKEKNEFKVTKDTLEMKGSRGQSQKFTRVKEKESK